MRLVVTDQAETVRSRIGIAVHNDSVAFQVNVTLDAVLLPNQSLAKPVYISPIMLTCSDFM